MYFCNELIKLSENSPFKEKVEGITFFYQNAHKMPDGKIKVWLRPTMPSGKFGSYFIVFKDETEMKEMLIKTGEFV
ncbi:MAG: hypothetical protein KF802_02360 [Bdellovibrionaceae bacterium]|nr:hypothetical protein [Pseudobdellovibrionaceae bacterium]